MTHAWVELQSPQLYMSSNSRQEPFVVSQTRMLTAAPVVSCWHIAGMLTDLLDTGSWWPIWSYSYLKQSWKSVYKHLIVLSTFSSCQQPSSRACPVAASSSWYQKGQLPYL
jgi:hypothetical protein